MEKTGWIGLTLWGIGMAGAQLSRDWRYGAVVAASLWVCFAASVFSFISKSRAN